MGVQKRTETDERASVAPAASNGRSARRRSLRVVLALASFVAIAIPTGTALAAHWRDGYNPSGCSASPQRIGYLSYGPNDNYALGQVQLRFSDPCDIIWSRVCMRFSNGYAISQRAYRGANSVGIGTSTQTGRAGTDYSQPACGSSVYSRADWSYGVFADCSEDYGSSCPTWVEGSGTGGGYFDSASTVNNKF